MQISGVGMGNQDKGQRRLPIGQSGRDGCSHGDLQSLGKSVCRKTIVLPHLGQRVRGGKYRQ